MNQLILISGGARSGKSFFAESCLTSFSKVIYMATARHPQEDIEMKERIRLHKERRPASWLTLEPPEDIEGLYGHVLRYKPQAILIDCATLWLAWRMMESFDKYDKVKLENHLKNEIMNFIDLLKKLPCSVFIVSNEVGLGVVPEHFSGRLFRDLQGILNARLAEAASLVCMCWLGQPLLLKGEPQGYLKRITPSELLKIIS